MLTTPLRKNTHVKKHMGEMLPLETKQFSGGKLLPHSDLRGGVSLEEVSCHRKRKRDTLVGMWNVRSLYRAGSLMEMMLIYWEEVFIR